MFARNFKYAIQRSLEAKHGQITLRRYTTLQHSIISKHLPTRFILPSCRRFSESIQAGQTSQAKPTPIKPKKFEGKKVIPLKKTDEVEFFSIGGIFVIACGAAVCYALYKVDQTRHTGIDWVSVGFASWFRSRKTLKDYCEYREEHPFKPLPQNWGFKEIVGDHIKNYVTFKGNEEGLNSKLYRCVSLPERRLLPTMKVASGWTMRTLVVDVGTICHSTWHREKGYERELRPGWKNFITRMAHEGWEIVMFSQDEMMDWEESGQLQMLDPTGGMIQNYLWRKDIYYYNSHFNKDLSRMNRKLDSIVHLDSDPRACQLQPENAILLSPWRGANPNDTDLEDVAEFLSYMGKADVKDVREELKEYRGEHVPSAFKRDLLAMLQGSVSE